MSKKRILVVSQYFFPEQFRINDICETWVEKGYQVTVLTGIPNYPQGEFYEGYGFRRKRKESYKDVKIVRIPIIPRGKSSIMLALNYFSFIISGYIWNWLNKEKFDSVFIYEVSPMTQALPAVKISKKLRIPCYIYVMDLWPENFEIITGIHQKTIIKCLNKMVDYIYQNCTKIFTASKSFRDNIIARGVSESKVIYWPQYAEEFYKPINNDNQKIKEARDKIINITFAGNVGFGQGLDLLPKVAQKIKKENLNVVFNIVGDGRYKSELIETVKNEKLETVFNFFDPIPAKKISDFFSTSDFSFICLKPDPIFEMTIPAKLQSSMACGKAILLSSNGEVQQIVKEAECGLYSDSGDIEGLFNNIKQLADLSDQQRKKMSENSLKYYRDNFEKSMLMDKMDTYILGDVENVRK